ncbi:Catabolic 3-dehydroquinase [Dirofilaria immitis]
MLEGPLNVFIVKQITTVCCGSTPRETTHQGRKKGVAGSKNYTSTSMGSPDALLGTETIAQLAISNPVKTEEPIGL